MATSIKISDLCNCLFGNQIQELENAARKLLYRLKIDKAEGTQLDGIGSIVGQERLGYNDEYYRVLLKVKIGINVSEGDIERILTLWRLLTDADITLTELFPAKIKLTTSEYVDPDLLVFMKDIARLALAGGVGIDTVIIQDPTRFGFGPTFGKFGSLWADSY